MKLKVLNKEGADTGRTITLSAEVFGIEPNDHAIYLDVKQFMANQRQGTHKSKLTPKALRRGKKYAAYCDGCWTVTKLLSKGFKYSKLGAN